MGRLFQASSMAGFGLLFNALQALVVNHRDPVAWGQVVTGVLAVVVDEKKVASGAR